MDRLVPFHRLSTAIQRECRGILDSFYTDLCEDYLFAVLATKANNVIAILQYDEDYQKANVLWGNWMVTCRALANELDLDHSLYFCQRGALHVSWEKQRKRIVDIVDSDSDSDFDEAEEEEACEVVTDIPDAEVHIEHNQVRR